MISAPRWVTNRVPTMPAPTPSGTRVSTRPRCTPRRGAAASPGGDGGGEVAGKQQRPARAEQGEGAAEERREDGDSMSRGPPSRGPRRSAPRSARWGWAPTLGAPPMTNEGVVTAPSSTPCAAWSAMVRATSSERRSSVNCPMSRPSSSARFDQGLLVELGGGADLAVLEQGLLVVAVPALHGGGEGGAGGAHRSLRRRRSRRAIRSAARRGRRTRRISGRVSCVQRAQ